MRTHRRVAGTCRSFSVSVLGILLWPVATGLPASVQAQVAEAQGSSASDSSPCLQELNEQKEKPAKAEEKRPKAPSWLSRHAKEVFGTVGLAGGVALGSKVCEDKSPQLRAQCRMLGGVGGAFLGSKLGQMMSEAEQKQYQEAAYKVALTGRPQSLTLDKGCVLVEAESDATFEERQFELALASSVAPPQKLRSVAMTHVRPSSASVSGTPASGKGFSKVAANVPSFVMGSTEGGKWLLLGREHPELNFVGAGYVDAKEWVEAPESTPSPIADTGGDVKMITLGVEVKCQQVSSTFLVEASNKQGKVSERTCILPDGVAAFADAES